jgi:hypothetical protein
MRPSYLLSKYIPNGTFSLHTEQEFSRLNGKKRRLEGWNQTPLCCGMFFHKFLNRFDIF